MPSAPDQFEDDLDLIPTSVDDWNEERGFVVQLPSGKNARVERTLDMIAMVTEGKIPNPLRGVVLGQMEAAKGGASAEQAGQAVMGELLEDDEMLSQFNDLLNRVTCQVMIEPPVSMPIPRGEMSENPTETAGEYEQRLSQWTPDPGTVSIYKIELNDKLFLFAVAQGSVADAKRFREQQGGGVSAAQAGEVVRDASERPARPAPTGRTGGKSKAKKPAAKKSPAKKAPARKSPKASKRA